MLIRSSPAAASLSARAARPIPFVVSAITGAGDSAAMSATSSSRFLRSKGSPPVNRTVLMPSRSTPMAISRRISSSVSTSAPGIQSSPSAGMQYVHRRLQRSVSETRRSVAIRPKPSASFN